MLATALLVLTTASAAPGELHVGVAAGLQVPAQASPRFTWAGLPRASWWPSEHWGVLAELAATPGLELDGHAFQAIDPRLGALWAPWTEPAIAPHLGAGLGLALHDSDLRLNDSVPAELTDTHLRGWAGLGLSWRAMEWLAASADLRWTQGLGAADPHHAVTGAELSIGLSLIQPLGPDPSIADEDGDGVVDALDECEGVVGHRDHRGCPAPTGIQPPDASVWFPHDHCEHVHADDLDKHLDQVEPDLQVVVSAPGYLPAYVPAEKLDGLALEPAPAQGALVVVASPGDRVKVAGVEVTPGMDGVVLLNVPDGPTEIEIAGGGRETRGPVAVAQGHATWVRVPAAEPQRALFTAGSATLDAEQSALVKSMAGLRGDYAYVLRGGYSPDGEQGANLALAEARAKSVHAVLVEAGVPDELIELAPILAPELDGQPELQRSCSITPIPGAR